ncbi:MAG TPA: hypothetical protein VM692_10995 [Gammaproteobacteria bacterium]|nr:hypothetical protein [Gammaproteobacteria bacterium]
MRMRTTALSAAVFVALAALSTSSQGQSAAAAAEPYTVPRTSWGHPDLQGVWDYRTITPLERRPELGDREFYTEEEIAQLEGRATRRMTGPPDPNAPANLVHAEYLTDPGRMLDESHRTSLIVDPPNGRMPPLTPEAQERQAQGRPPAGAPARVGGRADSYTDRSMLERCITRGAAGAPMPTLYNNNVRITQGPNSVALVHEMVHETRIVPLDDTPFGNVRTYQGESRGHWEGDTLVVETRNFNGKAPFRGAGTNLKIVERYTRTAPDKLDFKVTFEDDTQWTQPWTAAFTMNTGEGELYEYACHEGNYGLRNILENARDEERKAAAEKRR